MGSILAASSGSLVLRHARPGATVTGIPVTLPLSFEANRGQADSRVHYFARGPGYAVFLTDREAVLTLKAGAADRGPLTSEAGRERPRLSSGAVVRIQPVAARMHAKVQALDQLPGISNYFIGSDPAKWRTGIPTYEKVKYEGIYPGVDLVYYGNQRQLEFDFVVAPGADPSTIGLAFQGIDSLEVGPQGDLVLKIGSKEVRMQKPSVYQLVQDRRQTIPGEYVVKDENQVGFMVAAYDASKPLVIDPTLSYSTYLGGSNTEQGNGIAVDSTGNAYVVGLTSSADFPLAPIPGPLDATLGGSQDAFVAKVNASGTELIYSTYLGGSNTDAGNGIAVDSTGNAYVVGTTSSSDFPVVPTLGGALDNTLGGSQDAFVAKLDAAGTALTYSTYLGGSSIDAGNGIAVDSTGNAYVVGLTSSADFPLAPIPGPLDATLGGSQDAFVVKITESATPAPPPPPTHSGEGGLGGCFINTMTGTAHKVQASRFPEPSTMLFLGTGLVGLAELSRKLRK